MSDELRELVLPRLQPDDYEGLPTAVVFRAIVKLNNEGSSINLGTLMEEVSDDPDARGLLTRLAIEKTADSFEHSISLADSYLKALKRLAIDRRIDDTNAELAEAERLGDSVRQHRLMAERLELDKLRKLLFAQAEG